MHEHPVILFDGVCNLCNGTINFLIRIDKGSVFRFAPLQSGRAMEILKSSDLPSEPDSFILVYKEKIYSKSSGALKVFSLLPWYWQWTQLFWLMPRPIRDGVYHYIARNRYKWFGKKEQCMIPSANLRKRFL